jgi:hypothetical protein
MHQMRARLNQPVTTIESPDDILGQFYFAFGQGAGTMRVRREAIAALRRRYRPAIQTSAAVWPEAAGNVLSLLTQVGRLAALLATQAGRTAITEADFTQARQTVEASVHRRHESGGLVAGPFCPRSSQDDAIDSRREDDRAPEEVFEQPLDPETLEAGSATIN